MSKMDALRAMREAKFERGNRGASATTGRRTPVPPVAPPRSRVVQAATAAEAPAGDALC